MKNKFFITPIVFFILAIVFFTFFVIGNKDTRELDVVIEVMDEVVLHNYECILIVDWEEKCSCVEISLNMIKEIENEPILEKTGFQEKVTGLRMGHENWIKEYCGEN